MKNINIKHELSKFNYIETWLSNKTYFISAKVKGDYESCIVMFYSEPITAGQAFQQKKGAVSYIYIQDLSKSKYVIDDKFINLIINQTRKSINYFVFEMADGKKFNYFLKFNDFFIFYPNGYSSDDVLNVYSNKVIINNKLVDFDVKYKNSLNFYKAHDYIVCFY